MFVALMSRVLLQRCWLQFLTSVFSLQGGCGLCMHHRFEFDGTARPHKGRTAFVLCVRLRPITVCDLVRILVSYFLLYFILIFNMQTYKLDQQKLETSTPFHFPANSKLGSKATVFENNLDRGAKFQGKFSKAIYTHRHQGKHGQQTPCMHRLCHSHRTASAG